MKTLQPIEMPIVNEKQDITFHTEEEISEFIYNVGSFQHSLLAAQELIISNTFRYAHNTMIMPKTIKIQNVHIAIKINYRHNGYYPFISIFTLGLLPSWHAVYFEVEYIVYKSSGLVNTYKYNLERKDYYGFIFQVWGKHFTKSEELFIKGANGTKKYYELETGEFYKNSVRYLVKAMIKDGIIK